MPGWSRLFEHASKRAAAERWALPGGGVGAACNRDGGCKQGTRRGATQMLSHGSVVAGGTTGGSLATATQAAIQRPPPAGCSGKRSQRKEQAAPAHSPSTMNSTSMLPARWATAGGTHAGPRIMLQLSRYPLERPRVTARANTEGAASWRTAARRKAGTYSARSRDSNRMAPALLRVGDGGQGAYCTWTAVEEEGA